MSLLQLQALTASSRHSFVQRSCQFLRQAFADRLASQDQASLERYVQSMIDFGLAHQITREVNLQRLMAIHQKTGFAIPLTPYRAQALSGGNLPEQERIARFVRSLEESQPPTLVTL